MKNQIKTELLEMQDLDYRAFHSKIVPNIPNESIIGIRVPNMKAYAKRLLKEASKSKERETEVNEFLQTLPHQYYEENFLHMLLICEIRDFEECVSKMEAFLPYIDNWAVCDNPLPKVFEKHEREVLLLAKKWIASDQTYTIRYGIGVLMRMFLDERFEKSLAKSVAKLRSEEYYVNMMIAWYFATALAKQWDEIIPVLTEKKLSVWVHNKTIQKAVESYRITAEQKAYLKTLRIKAKKKEK